MTIARPPGIRHRDGCKDPTSVLVEYRQRGTRPFVMCEGCGAAGVVPTLATGSARAGYFATHDLIYTHPKKRSRTMFSNNRPTHDPTPPPAAAEKPTDYLPLTLVAAELAELGLDDPNHLARHVGRDRITLAAGLIRCISAATVADLVDQLEELRARKADAAARVAEQARILERKEFDAAVAERVHREKVQRVIDATGFPFIVASEIVTGSATRQASGAPTRNASRTCSPAARRTRPSTRQ